LPRCGFFLSEWGGDGGMWGGGGGGGGIAAETTRFHTYGVGCLRFIGSSKCQVYSWKRAVFIKGSFRKETGHSSEPMNRMHPTP